MFEVITNTTTSAIITTATAVAWIPQKHRPELTPEQLDEVALGEMNIRHWRLVGGTALNDRSKAAKMLRQGWIGMCLVGYSEKEYKALRKFLKSFSDIYVSRRFYEVQYCTRLGYYQSSETSIYFKTLRSYKQVCDFLDAIPKKTALINVSQHRVQKIMLFLKNAHPHRIDNDHGEIWISYCEEELSEEDRFLLELMIS